MDTLAADDMLRGVLVQQRDILISEVESEKEVARNSKSTAQRRGELERSLCTVEAKLRNNEGRLAEAQKQVTLLQSYVDSQTEKQRQLREELCNLAANEATQPTSGDTASRQNEVDRLEALLEATQRQLLQARQQATKSTAEGAFTRERALGAEL